MLPERLKECASLDNFKESIKSWVPDNCPCELCKTYVPGLGYASLFEWENKPDKQDLNCIQCAKLHALTQGLFAS